MPRSRLGRLSAAAAGGALTALALPRPGFWPLGFLGLIPVFSSFAASVPDAALAGFAAGLAYHVVVLHWIDATCRFARVPEPVGVLATLLLAAVLALNWAAAGALGRRLTERAPRGRRPWLWAAVWTAVAAATGWWTPRLAVDVLAYTQLPNLALIQIGAWGGPYALGFVIVLLASALAEEERSAPAVAAALGLLAAVWAHGAWELARRPDSRGATARVEILQPAIDQYRKFDASYVKEILSGFDELLSRPRPRPPALVVWPETSIPRWTPREEAAPEAARWAERLGAQNLVGVVATGPANGVQLVTPQGTVDRFYEKRILVPYGEYVPLRSWVPRFVIDRWLMVLDQFGDLDAGASAQPLFDTPLGPAAVTICYEAMFPRLARADAARGAKLIVNVTNDGWYKDTWGPYQHFGSNVFRAIENRAAVVRSGNTGISAVIDPWGVITDELPLNVRGRLDADVPLDDPFPGRSFYVRHGDWLGSLCLILVVLLLLRRAV